jgi:hypothetical protein
MTPDSSKRTDEIMAWGGLSPRYWAEALALQGDRVGETYDALIQTPPNSDDRRGALRQLHVDAHFLLIALAHLLRALRTCADILDDALVKDVQADFETRAPWIKNFRDVLEHLDDYMAGRGRLTGNGTLPPGAFPVLGFDPMPTPVEVVVHLGPWRLPLRNAAKGGERLGLMLADACEAQFGPEPPNILWGRSGSGSKVPPPPSQPSPDA